MFSRRVRPRNALNLGWLYEKNELPWPIRMQGPGSGFYFRALRVSLRRLSGLLDRFRTCRPKRVI
jgi:hypothetical protein